MLPTIWKGACRCEAMIRATSRCSVTSRRKRACGRTIRCGRFGAMTDAALAAVVAALRPVVLDDRPAVDSARAVAARPAAADALQHSQRAAADGGARLQRPVSLVCRPEPGRSDLGRDDVHEESRPAARRRRRGRVLCGSARRDQGRTGCCRTSTSRSTARCSRRGPVTRVSSRRATRPHAARRSEESDGEFPRADAAQRHASVDDRSRRAALQERRSATKPKLAYLGHLLTENRHGFIVDTAVTAASGHGRTRRGDRHARRAAADHAGASPSAPTRCSTRARGSRPSAGCASRRTSPQYVDRPRRQCDRRPDDAPRRLSRSVNASGS